MTTRLIGEPVQRSEDRRILAGHGTFIDDIEPAGCLHVAMVRSTCANGRILGIETSAAAAREDVVAVYTAADLGELGRQTLPLLIPNPNLTEPRTQLPLAAEYVHFVGEAVAMVVATSRYAADDAAEFVEVTYEPLPAVVGPVAAFEGGDVVHADMTGNVAAHVGGVQASLLAAQRLVFRLHRLLLAWGTSGSAALCGRYRMPIMKKSQYRWQMTQPVPASSPLTGCNPTGRSSVLWEALRELPAAGENFGYLLWRKRTCCLL